MDVILHIGAHRTATTTFQHYARGQSQALATQGVAFWGPGRTRNGLFRGLYDRGAEPAADADAAYRRATGRIALNAERARDRGRKVLIVSDENMAGSVRENLRTNTLYPGIGMRLARVHGAFGGKVDQVILSIRSLELYWASALGFGLTRGRRVPDENVTDRLVTSPRSWRDVIADVACAMPEARLRVLPFETLNGRPDAMLSEILDQQPVPRDPQEQRLNATPGLASLRDITGGAGLPKGDGRWQPFNTEQAAALRETYQDDLIWLAAGADGMAEPMAYMPRKTTRHEAGTTPPETDMTRGRSNDSQQRRMAPPRRG